MQQRPAPTVVEAFTPVQRALGVAVLNRLIPARGTLPGAGDLGVLATIEQTLAQQPALLRLFLDGLRDVEMTGRGAAFADASGEEQDAHLRQVETDRPAFFTLLLEQTYRGYYSLPEVQRSIGLSGNPPQPQGYRLAPFDPALLAVQRQRAPFWRKAE